MRDSNLAFFTDILSSAGYESVLRVLPTGERRQEPASGTSDAQVGLQGCGEVPAVNW